MLLAQRGWVPATPLTWGALGVSGAGAVWCFCTWFVVATITAASAHSAYGYAGGWSTWAAPRYAVLCCAVLSYVVLSLDTIVCWAVPCCVVLFCVVCAWQQWQKRMHTSACTPVKLNLSRL